MYVVKSSLSHGDAVAIDDPDNDPDPPPPPLDEFSALLSSSSYTNKIIQKKTVSYKTNHLK